MSILILLLAIVPAEAGDNLNPASEEIFTEFKFIPPQDGKKPQTKGAGTRNPDALRCNAKDSEALAIMPEDNYGLTVRERPEIFVLLPKTAAKQVVLSFESQDKEYHQVAFLPVDPNSKIQSFALPQDKLGLESDRYYQWKLTLVCGNLPHVDDPVLSGWVRRQEADLNTSEIANRASIAQAQWYGINGYWYDLLWQIKQIETNNYRDISTVDIWSILEKKY